MKKNTHLMSSILIALFGVLLAVPSAFAVDPPHNGQNSLPMTMSCNSCHYDATTGTPLWATQPTTTDDTFYNNLCNSCHNNISMSGNPAYVVKTHSTSNTSGKYPGWTVECRTCHNPHYQEMITSYSTDTTANLASGTLPINVVSTTTATQTFINVTPGSPMAPNEYIDHILIPNVLYPSRMYRILSNTGTRFTVIGPVNPNYAKAASRYAVRQGTMLSGKVLTPTGYGSTTVKFFTSDNTKPNSYAWSTDPANVTGICQVCHTQTKSFNRDPAFSPDPANTYIQESPNHPTVIGTQQRCTECHIHTEGFKGACNSCHGSPPVDAATLISKDASGTTVTSDSVGAGAHARHVTSLGYTCTNCHFGGMLAGQSEGDSKINIGFNMNSTNLGGNYDGKTGRTVYTYASGTGSTTTVSAGNSMTCTSLYCHSSGQSLNGASATPVYAVPNWTAPATGACGTCHAVSAPLISTGSHTTHLNGTGVCGDCHTGATASSYVSPAHVNRSIDLAYTYSKDGTPGNGYGTCSNATCHVSAYGVNTVVTPTWGTTGNGCTACHSIAIATTGPATGGHALHNVTDCSQCHSGATNNTTAPSANHIDGNIDVIAGYPADVAKHAAGSGYATCSAASCHANVYGSGTSTTPVWGSTGNGCSACHSTPIATTGPNTGGHVLHNETNCTLCHNAATSSTTVPSTGHADGNIDIANVGYPVNVTKHAAGSGYTTCSTASCHANVYGAGTTTTPVWGTTGNGCSACHSVAIAAYGPNTGGHALHNETNCALCHQGALNSTTTPTQNHIDTNIDTANVGYTTNITKHAAGSGYTTCSTASCHANVYGVGSSVTPTWGTTGNGCSACHSLPITATGPATGSHALHANSAGTLCTTCHVAGTSSGTVPSTGHTDGNIDVTSGYPANVTKHAAGSGYQSCSTTACHGTTSPTWGANTASAQCVKCHGVAGTTPAAYLANPDTAAPGYNATGRDTSGSNGTPFAGGVSPDLQVGAHDTHLRGVGGYKTNGIVCTDCHAVNSLSSAGHMNSSTTFSWSALATKNGTLTPGYSAGVCSNVYCHGAGTTIVATQGTDTTPLWTDGAYLGNAAVTMNNADCNKCHQSPPFANVSYGHGGVTLGAGNCTGCHGHDGAGASHIDGNLQATGGACDACHDYDLDANGDWGKNLKAIEGWGAHALHISHLKTLAGIATLDPNEPGAFGGANYTKVCGACHTLNGGNHAMGGTPNTRSITFSDGSATYQFSSLSGSPTYSGLTGTSSAATPKTCSNVSCHFQPAPVWQGI